MAEPYRAPVSGTPGLKTLKNLLATALEPVGTTLYVYGGSWDWQDSCSANQAMTIGLPQSWIDFFQQQDVDYDFKAEDEDTAIILSADGISIIIPERIVPDIWAGCPTM